MASLMDILFSTLNQFFREKSQIFQIFAKNVSTSAKSELLTLICSLICSYWHCIICCTGTVQVKDYLKAFNHNFMLIIVT